MLESIDVSVANGKIDWVKVAAAGISFVYVKATDGVNYIDPTFFTNAKGALAAGLPVGAYHYLKVRHGKAQDAQKQALQYCEAYVKAGCTLVPALDCEDATNKDATPDEWLEAIRTWVAVVEDELGCKPLLYTYPGFWGSLGPKMNLPEFGELKLWIAHYTTAPKPMMVKPWTSWFMWQYAASAGVFGRVDGVSTYVDRNRCVGTLDDLLVNPSKKEETTVPEEPVASTEEPKAEPVIETPAPIVVAPPAPVQPPVQQGSGLLQVIMLIINAILSSLGMKR